MNFNRGTKSDVITSVNLAANKSRLTTIVILQAELFLKGSMCLDRGWPQSGSAVSCLESEFFFVMEQVT